MDRQGTSAIPFLIVGGGLAGARAAQALREDLTIPGASPYLPTG